MIAIVDFGAGNLASVRKALARAGAEAVVSSDPEQVRCARRLVLPGVGHFSATRELARRGLDAALAGAIAEGRPLLAICVGLQWLYEGSAEAPGVPGLGLAPGRNEPFPAHVRSPHVGWNRIRLVAPSRWLQGLDGEFFYFTHSFRAPALSATAVCDHGGEFCAALERDNLLGVQFHPEKSGPAGLRLLRRFLETPC